MLARSIRLVIYYLKHKTVPITSWNIFVPGGRAIDSILLLCNAVNWANSSLPETNCWGVDQVSGQYEFRYYQRFDSELHFGWLYDRIIPRLFSKLTRFLDSYLIYQYMKFNLSLSHHPKTILKVNSVLRIVPQLSIYDVHRVHFGRLGDLNLPRLRSKLTLCLQPYLRYRYMTFGRLYDRIIPRLCSKLTLRWESVPQVSIYDVRQIVRSHHPKAVFKVNSVFRVVPHISI